MLALKIDMLIESLPLSLSTISTTLRPLDTLTPGKSAKSLTVKFSLSSTMSSSIIVILMHESAPMVCPTTKVRTCGRPK